MKYRNPRAPLLLPIVTFGIYGIVWYVKTKNELNAIAGHIPTAWWWLVPFGAIYWLWRYSVSVETLTQRDRATTFLLLIRTGPIGMAITQSAFNQHLAPA